MHLSVFTVLLIFTAYSIASAAVGVWLISVPDLARRFIPFSGAILVVVTLFWLLPELAATLGWTTASLLLLAGSVSIYLIDRYIYPVCPACSPEHGHAGCTTRLHGFALPLMVAAMLHGMFDGWALSAGVAEGAVGRGISLAIAIHRLPEGFAFGVILRAALNSRSRAMMLACLAQSALLVGGGLEMATSSSLGTYWISTLLSLAGGTLLFLGLHAVHGEWKRRVAAQRRG